jgi:hypothetical protein
MVEWHDITINQHTDNDFRFKIINFEENTQKMFIRHIQFDESRQNSSC